MAEYVVGPNGRDGWKVTKVGNERASVNTDTQAEAYAKAREFAANQGGGEVSIQGRNGQIRDKNTIAPAKDPGSSKG